MKMLVIRTSDYSNLHHHQQHQLQSSQVAINKHAVRNIFSLISIDVNAIFTEVSLLYGCLNSIEWKKVKLMNYYFVKAIEIQ